jgi:DNA polymerase-4
MIACVLITHFAAAVERRQNPALAETPLVITEPFRKTEKVFAVSEEAAQLGVEPGVPVRQAETICPQARFIAAGHNKYQRAFDELLGVLETLSPVIEVSTISNMPIHPAAIVYLDLTDQKRQAPSELGLSIGQTIKEKVRLAPALGLGHGKFTTYIAAVSAGSNNYRIVASGKEEAFLAPFPVDILPAGEETIGQLKLFGIYTLEQLSALPPAAILMQFGKEGQFLHKLARGDDDRPLTPRQACSDEQVTFQFDGSVNDWATLEKALQGTVAELTNRLAARGVVGHDLRLTVYLDDGSTCEEQIIMRRPYSDQKRLTNVLTELLAKTKIHCGVVELRITLDNLVTAVGQQLDLFVHETYQEKRLQDVLNDLINRYGSQCFYQASLTDRGSLLPELRFQLKAVDRL